MFTALSSSTPTLNSTILDKIGRDASARSSWFITPLGLDSYWQVIKYPNIDEDLLETALRLPKGHLEARPLPSSAAAFKPKTELAKRLWEIRLRSIASGENDATLDWEGVAKEVAERRGDRG